MNGVIRAYQLNIAALEENGEQIAKGMAAFKSYF